MVLVQYVIPEGSISPGQESPCNRIRPSIRIVVAYRASADNGDWGINHEIELLSS